MLEIDGLVVDAKEQPRLGPLRLSVRPGEVLGLVGPSGCGKTLLLRSLAGLQAPRAGEISWHGRRLSLREQRSGRLVRMLDDRARLAPGELALAEALELVVALRGEAPAIAQELLRRWELEPWARVPLERLPSGSEERLRLAILDLGHPGILLLDHPLAHLDPRGQALLAGWLDDARSRQAAILWAGPAPGRLARAADRLALLSGERLLTRLLVRGEAGPSGAWGEALEG